MERIAIRTLPDGRLERLQPVHVCLEGMEETILCRDDDDYDALVKIMMVAARKKNVIVVIYAVVSNHFHATVLALCQEDAHLYGEEVKRRYSMWFSRKHGEKKAMKGVSVSAIVLENDWHVRNALAYVPRNALDNGCRVSDYPWSGYSAMFRPKGEARRGTPVSELTKRECEEFLHTGENLRDVTWLMDERHRLIPESICDKRYLEQAFNGDPAYFLKTIGNVNPAEMQWKLVDSPRRRQPDTEFLTSVNDVSLRWFNQQLGELPIEKKLRLIPYINRTMKTTIPQLARTFGLSRETVGRTLYRKNYYL
jgi:REP element-mobilizing transposase RayT